MLVRFLVFFFKQKTAYEMRISDWSSDVCSSDLTMFEKARMRSGAEHSYGAPGHGLNGIRLTLAGSRYLRISRTSSRASSSLSFLSFNITYSNVIRRALLAPG